MISSHSRQTIHSLADMRAGDDARISHIAFETIRERCPALGIDIGAVVHCTESRGWELVLRTSLDREIVVDRFYAAFIEASPVAGPTDFSLSDKPPMVCAAFHHVDCVRAPTDARGDRDHHS